MTAKNFLLVVQKFMKDAKNYTDIDKYIKYLYHSNLIINKKGEVEITDFGIDFIKYIR